MAKTSVYLRYIGKDKASLPGVPARDLTYGETKDLNIDIVKLLQSGLYQYAYEEEIPQDMKKLLGMKVEEQIKEQEVEETPKKKRRVKHGE